VHVSPALNITPRFRVATNVVEVKDNLTQVLQLAQGIFLCAVLLSATLVFIALLSGECVSQSTPNSLTLQYILDNIYLVVLAARSHSLSPTVHGIFHCAVQSRHKPLRSKAALIRQLLLTLRPLYTDVSVVLLVVTPPVLSCSRQISPVGRVRQTFSSSHTLDKHEVRAAYRISLIPSLTCKQGRYYGRLTLCFLSQQYSGSKIPQTFHPVSTSPRTVYIFLKSCKSRDTTVRDVPTRGNISTPASCAKIHYRCFGQQSCRVAKFSTGFLIPSIA
jgi:hypothetical protein